MRKADNRLDCSHPRINFGLIAVGEDPSNRRCSVKGLFTPAHQDEKELLRRISVPKKSNLRPDLNSRGSGMQSACFAGISSAGSFTRSKSTRSIPPSLRNEAERTVNWESQTPRTVGEPSYRGYALEDSRRESRNLRRLMRTMTSTRPKILQSTQMSRAKGNAPRGFSSDAYSDQANPLSADDITRKLAQLEPVKGKFRDLTKLFLMQPVFLELAYTSIKNKKGNTTPGASPETLGGISKLWFIYAAERLKLGTYKFSPTRRLDIPKRSGETRQLSVGGPRDKIIQEAVRLLLEYIYEHKLRMFHDASHGFRPGRSCHTALKSIKYGWIGIPWYIEFDINQAFDSVNRNKLLSLLGDQIQDSRLFGLLRKMFNAGVVMPLSIVTHTEEGNPQGNPLSPLLCNIYLTELDRFVDKLRVRYETGQRATRNPEYHRLVRLSEAESRGLSRHDKARILEVRRREARAKGITPTLLDDNYIRIKYVRYADDFIVGVRGPKELARRIQKEISTFLKSQLHLSVNQDKTKLTHTYYNKARFLGTEIHNVPGANLPYRNSRRLENLKRKRTSLLARFRAAEQTKLKLWRTRTINRIFRVVRGKSTAVKDRLERALSEIAQDMKAGGKVVSQRELLRELAARTLDLATETDDQFLKNVKTYIEREYTSSLLDVKYAVDHKLKTPDSPGGVLKTIGAVDIFNYIYEQMLRPENYDGKGRPYDFGRRPPTRSIYKLASTSQLRDLNYLPPLVKLDPDLKRELDHNLTLHKKSIKTQNWQTMLKWLSKIQRQNETQGLVTKVPDNLPTAVPESYPARKRRTGLPPQIRANMDEIYRRLADTGVINKKKKTPTPKSAHHGPGL